jgi:hypothetical protein
MTRLFRASLIKAGIDYRETTPTSMHYAKNVVPRTGGRQDMPTIELQSGAVIATEQQLSITSKPNREDMADAAHRPNG